jgi:hypothetical protein
MYDRRRGANLRLWTTRTVVHSRMFGGLVRAAEESAGTTPAVVENLENEYPGRAM